MQSVLSHCSYLGRVYHLKESACELSPCKYFENELVLAERLLAAVCIYIGMFTHMPLTRSPMHASESAMS